MANALAPAGGAFTHTYAGKEILQPLFYQPQTIGRDPFELYQVMGDIKTKANIYLPGKLQKIITADGGCGFTPSGSATISDKTITPEKLKINLEMCSDEFDQTIFAEQYKAGVDVNNIEGTDIGNIILQLLVNSMSEDIPKIIWWSDITSGDPFYGNLDGYIKLIDSAVTAGTLTNFVDLTAGGFVIAGVWQTDGALGALRALYSGQEASMRGMNRMEKKIMVNSAVIDNLLDSYENTGTDSGLARLAEGVGELTFRGIPVVEMPTWTEAMADGANPQAGTVGDNCIVFTIPDNLVVGSNIQAPESQVLVWYDVLTELVNFKVKFTLGAQIIHPELIGFAHD